MTDPAAPPAETPTRAEERAAMLREAAAVEMRTLRALDAEVAALAEAPRDADRAAKLETLARSVREVARALRLTLALEERFEENREVRSSRAIAAAEKAEADRAEDLRTRKRAHLGFALERAVQTSQDPSANIRRRERLACIERLVERESIERDPFLARPLRELLTRVCAELGLQVHPGVWREADWAEVEAVAGPPLAQPPGAVAVQARPSAMAAPVARPSPRGAQAPP